MRSNCESAARKLGAKNLRSVELRLLEANKSKLTPREYQCAHHVVAEIARVVAGERSLEDQDHRQFGQYMFQSHESSRDFLKNSTPELDLLVELARAHPGCLGSRLTGGGFGGATINLVSYHRAEAFMEFMARQYETRSGHNLLTGHAEGEFHKCFRQSGRFAVRIEKRGPGVRIGFLLNALD